MQNLIDLAHVMDKIDHTSYNEGRRLANGWQDQNEEKELESRDT